MVDRGVEWDESFLMNRLGVSPLDKILLCKFVVMQSHHWESLPTKLLLMGFDSEYIAVVLELAWQLGFPLCKDWMQLV